MSYVVTPSRCQANQNPNPSWNEACRKAQRVELTGLLGAHKWNFISALLPTPVRHLLQLLLLLGCSFSGCASACPVGKREGSWLEGQQRLTPCLMLRRDMPIILLHLFVCTLPLSGRCHHSTPTTPTDLSPLRPCAVSLSLFVCALNEMKIAAHCEALKAANRRAKFHFITKAKAEWKKPKTKRKKIKRKTKTKI